MAMFLKGQVYIEAVKIFSILQGGLLRRETLSLKEGNHRDWGTVYCWLKVQQGLGCWKTFLR